jgi:hypothetical protein
MAFELKKVIFLVTLLLVCKNYEAVALNIDKKVAGNPFLRKNHVFLTNVLEERLNGFSSVVRTIAQAESSEHMQNIKKNLTEESIRLNGCHRLNCQWEGQLFCILGSIRQVPTMEVEYFEAEFSHGFPIYR